jgi:hypothetical protein
MTVLKVDCEEGLGQRIGREQWGLSPLDSTYQPTGLSHTQGAVSSTFALTFGAVSTGTPGRR